MGNMNEQQNIQPIDPDEAERLALQAAVAEARADPRPDIPHEEVRAEMLANIERANRRLAELSARRKT
jgi:hypothetical protein